MNRYQRKKSNRNHKSGCWDQRITVLNNDWYDKFKKKKSQEVWNVFKNLPFELHGLVGEFCDDKTLVNYLTSYKDIYRFFNSRMADYFWKKRFSNSGLHDILTHPRINEKRGTMDRVSFYSGISNCMVYRRESSQEVGKLEGIDQREILLIKKEETEGQFCHDILINLLPAENEDNVMSKTLQIRNTIDFSVLQVVPKPKFWSGKNDAFVYEITETCFLFLFLHHPDVPVAFITRVPSKRNDGEEKDVRTIDQDLFEFSKDCPSEMIKLMNNTYCFFGRYEQGRGVTVQKERYLYMFRFHDNSEVSFSKILVCSEDENDEVFDPMNIRMLNEEEVLVFSDRSLYLINVNTKTSSKIESDIDGQPGYELIPESCFSTNTRKNKDVILLGYKLRDCDDMRKENYKKIAFFDVRSGEISQTIRNVCEIDSETSELLILGFEKEERHIPSYRRHFCVTAMGHIIHLSMFFTHLKGDGWDNSTVSCRVIYPNNPFEIELYSHESCAAYDITEACLIPLRDGRVLIWTHQGVKVLDWYLNNRNRSTFDMIEEMKEERMKKKRMIFK